MSFLDKFDKFTDKVSSFSSDFSGRISQQITTLKEQGIKLPTFTGFFGNLDASPSINKQNNLALHQVALNVATTRVPGMPLEMPPPTTDGERVFKTIGGEWRKTETGSPHFYRPGEDTAGTKLFDREYYQPPVDQYEMAREGYWIKLAPDGGRRDWPENKDKPQPENVSDFEWRGFAWCHPDNVPADYKTEGKTVAFANEQAAQNPVNALKRYVAENGLADGLPWDEKKATNAFENVITSGGRIELEKLREEGGKSVYLVKMDDESLGKLRTELAKYKEAVGSDARGGADAPKQGTYMMGDTAKVYVRAGENTAEGTANTLLEVIDPSIKIDPHNLTRARIGDIMDSQLPPPQNGAREHALPRVDLSPIRPDYSSDLFNRDILTGKVNKDGVTVGKMSETAVELVAPVVAGKVFAPVELPISPLPQGKLIVEAGRVITPQESLIAF